MFRARLAASHSGTPPLVACTPSQVSQQGLVHWVFWRWWHFPLDVEDPYVSAMNLFYFWYWHLPLAQGGSVVLIPDAINLDIRKVPIPPPRGSTGAACTLTPHDPPRRPTWKGSSPPWSPSTA